MFWMVGPGFWPCMNWPIPCMQPDLKEGQSYIIDKVWLPKHSAYLSGHCCCSHKTAILSGQADRKYLSILAGLTIQKGILFSHPGGSIHWGPKHSEDREAAASYHCTLPQPPLCCHQPRTWRPYHQSWRSSGSLHLYFGLIIVWVSSEASWIPFWVCRG